MITTEVVSHTGYGLHTADCAAASTLSAFTELLTTSASAYN